MAGKSGSIPRIATKAEIVKNKANIKLNEAKQAAVFHLKKLYLETLKVDVEVQREIFKVEKITETKYNKIYDERKNFLKEYNVRYGGDASNDETTLANFWLKVLKRSYSGLITDHDECVLQFLTDIRSVLNNEGEDVVNFVLEFSFEPNPFISDLVLKKTYYINCVPNPEDPYSFSGADIVKCEGCDIHWKKGREPQKSKYSFFEFFAPPELPNPEDPQYDDVYETLRSDYELGFYFKERVIPKAVLYFTGEISDCISSEEEEDETYEEEEEENDSDEKNSDNGEGGGSTLVCA